MTATPETPRPLQVVHLLDGRIHCGASMVTKTLVQALREAGTVAQLVCLYEGPVAASAREEGLTPEVLPTGSFLARLRGLRRRLDAAREAGRQPILHSHQLRANRFGSLAARGAGVPHVISVHTHKEEFLRDQFPNRAKRKLMRAIHYWTLDHAAARVAVSPGVQRQLLAHGYPEPRTRLIRNVTLLPEPSRDPAGIRRLVRESLGLPSDAWLVLAAGRLVPIKQFEVLLRALTRMTGPPLDRAVVLLAGDGELRAPLERLAADLGVTPRVRFLGWRDDLQGLIRACDCAVSSSRSECSPVFLIEAMALARPVVAAAAEDVAALIHDGEHGLLFPIGDPDALVEKLVLLAREPGRGRHLGEAARTHVRALFDVNRSVREMQALYADVCALPPGRESP